MTTAGVSRSSILVMIFASTIPRVSLALSILA